jgi:hypothetical protein
MQKRVEERANLLAQMSEDMSSPEDIKRARQVKELEPLKAAWDEWETNRQVHMLFWAHGYMFRLTFVDRSSFSAKPHHS